MFDGWQAKSERCRNPTSEQKRQPTHRTLLNKGAHRNPTSEQVNTSHTSAAYEQCTINHLQTRPKHGNDNCIAIIHAAPGNATRLRRPAAQETMAQRQRKPVLQDCRNCISHRTKKIPSRRHQDPRQLRFLFQLRTSELEEKWVYIFGGRPVVCAGRPFRCGLAKVLPPLQSS